MTIIEQTLLDLNPSKFKIGKSGKSFSERNYSVNQGSASTSAGRSTSGFGQAPNAASSATGSSVAQAHLGGNPITSSSAIGALGGMGSSASANITGVNVTSAKSEGMSTADWIIVCSVTVGVIILCSYIYLERKKEQEMVQEKANSENLKS